MASRDAGALAQQHLAQLDRVMKKPLIDNKEGLGLVAMFCQTVLDEQIAFVQRQASQLPQRTPEQDLEMAWDEGLML